jgi:GMP synthase-like glutamine amidotransferase
MKLGILKADALKPEFVEQFGEYPDMFARRIHKFDPTIELVTYDVQMHQYPEELDEVDAYLITGSKSSVYDQEPWLDALKDFVRQLHAAKKKVIGVCFGHQMIAEALGGKVTKADSGWCAGVHEAELTAKAKVLIGAESGKFHLISNHQDQVKKVAEGAEIMASTASCPCYMTVLGDHIMTIQGHPEFDPEFAVQLLDMRREILGEDLYQMATESLTTPTDSLLVVRWLLNFIR